MDVKDIDELQNYLAMLNAAGGKNLIVDFEAFKGLEEDKIIKIVSLAKSNGIRVFAKEENQTNISERRNKMRELGFQGYVAQRDGKLFKYDNTNLDAAEISIVQGYKNEDDLNIGLQSGSNPLKALKLSELLKVFDGENRSLTGKIAVLETFKSAILKINAGRMQDKDYVRSVGYNFKQTLSLSEENINDFCKAARTNDVLQAQAALNAVEGTSAYLYLKQLEDRLKNNPELNAVKMEFFKGLIIKFLSNRELEKAGIDKGLANEEFEILLGEKLLQRYAQGINAADISPEINAFMASEPTLNEINAKISEQAVQDLPQAINATIQLILLSEQKVGKITIEAQTPFTVSSIKHILSAA
jgi:hypothetical protein